MMETKLWFALCALLLINLASAEHDNDHNTPTTGAATTDAHTSQVAPGLNSTSQAAPALNVSKTNSSSTNTKAVGESATPTPTAKNDSKANISLTVNNKPEPTRSSVGQATTSHLLPTSIVTSPPHAADTVSVNTTNTTRPTHASTSTSQQPAQPKTNSSSPAANQTEPPKPETSTSATTSSGSTSGTSTGTRTQAHTSPPSQSATTQAQTQSTISPTGTGSSSTPTKANANTPSQLNVGGDTTMVHESPTLDPLMAGLVSAFIITGVIIMLLLFLKLRRRDNRPQFRRLQDLPMDDMMEDTPLSMYTY